MQIISIIFEYFWPMKRCGIEVGFITKAGFVIVAFLPGFLTH
jgi:hypothetical protein